jgi:polyferredoxin
VVWPSAWKIAITGLIVTAMFFTWRPWCRLLCPLGGIYGLFNRVSAFVLRFRPDRCTECGACRKPCRYGVSPGEQANDPRCIRCLECTKCGAFSFGAIFAGRAARHHGPFEQREEGKP